MPKYVIIGGSAAGIGAVEAIREVDPSGTIAVISEERCPQYSRPLIADFVSGKATLLEVMCREDDFWNKYEITVLTGRKAESIDFRDRCVALDDGNQVIYEKLLIATGGKPFLPRIEGSDKDGVFTFTTISDAERLAEKLENAKNIVVIGGGLIGVSAAEALIKRGLRVTLVELQDRLLSLLLDTNGSCIIEDAMRRSGVTIVTGQSVQKIIGSPKNNKIVDSVILANGCQIACDAVIIAIGVVPRTELVTTTELKLNRGIIVDNFMRTNLPDVFAGGDVAETWDFLLNQNRVLPLWPLAMSQGKVAGYNMAGKRTEYAGGTNMSSLKYFGIPVISIGMTNPKDAMGYEILVKHEPTNYLYKKIVLKNNTIVGIILVNDIERAGTLFHLMKSHTNVRRFKQELIADSFGLAALPASLRKTMCLGCVH